MNELRDIEAFQANLKSLIRGWNDNIKEFINNEEETFVKTQNKKLVERGEDSEGDKLGGGDKYSPVTVQLKRKYGQGYGRITSHITLYDKGDFQKGVYMKWEGNTDFGFDSTDDKRNKLVKDWGPNIFGINLQKDGKQLQQQIQPNFVKFIKQKLHI